VRSAVLVAALLSLPGLACETKREPTLETQAPLVSSVGASQAALTALPEAPRGTKLGEFAGTLPFVALEKVANDAKGYANLRIMTEGMITAVCQARGCWMEIADGEGRAHVKMHGHSFFSIPRNASGRRARVEAQVLAAPSRGECEREAQQQTGQAIRLQLDATGVELL
jgi:hypothetical protein